MQRGIAAASLALVGAITLAACAANGGDESILVLKNVLPGAGCMVTPGESETGVARGAVDVQFHTGYEFFAQVKSRITATTTQVDQRTIVTRGANVDITFADRTVFTDAELADFKTKNLVHFMSPFSVPIAPNDSIVDVDFELVPAELVAAIATKMRPAVALQTTFKVVGDLSGGDVSSQSFSYSVQVVSSGFRRDNGACANLSTSFVPKVGNSCNPGQDGVVDCCTMPDRNNPAVTRFVCPAVGTKT
ncbi:MAG: hypothetical protein E6J91_29475 [Deltaproteobacteria bacterium]|nr:MAG: hypothetical protein E6J91_29475 [Deltaproteobacteria bacterium]